jgi:hypothetical protein
MDSIACKLCLASGCTAVGWNKDREFLHCPSCGLIFVPPDCWLTPERERARYEHHDNTVANTGYVRFLDQIANVVADLVPKDAGVLDFGSGEHAVLTELLRRQGFAATAYDPLYRRGESALQGTYEVIVLCEVIEHLRELRTELLSLEACMNPGGYMIVRTQCYPPSVADIASWWYARDTTHVNFFSEKALTFAANLCSLRHVRKTPPDIFVFQRL